MADEAVAEVQRRLAAHKESKALCAAADKLKTDYSLAQQAELALRLLKKESIAELLAGGKELKDKLSQVPDASDLIVQLAVALDPDIQGLLDAIASADAEEEEPWPEDDGNDANAWPQAGANASNAWPQAGANASKVASAQANEITVIFKPGQPLGLSRENGTVLAVKAGGQAESLGVEVDMRIAKVNGQLCKSFDDPPFQAAKSSNRPFKVTFEKASKLAAQEDPPGLVKASKLAAQEDPPGLVKAQSRSVASSTLSAEEAMAETQRRLQENKKMPHYYTIVRWQNTFELSETAVLSLRMLSAPNLKEIFDNKDDFEEKFKNATVDKRNEIVETVAEALDPEATQILKTLKAAEEQAEAEESAGNADSQRSVAPPKDVAPTNSSVDDGTAKFVKFVQMKLKSNKALQGEQLTKEIERLRDHYGLSEDVEVTLRLLKPDDLRELLQTEKMLGGTPAEKKEAVEVMVQSTDEQATALANKLKALQEQEESNGGGNSQAIATKQAQQQQSQSQSGWPDWRKRLSSDSGVTGGESEEKKAKVANGENEQRWNGKGGDAQWSNGGNAQLPPQVAQMAKMFAAAMSGAGDNWSGDSWSQW